MDSETRRFLLKPNRSLNWTATAILFGLLVGWIGVLGVFSFTHKTWPILGFAGLELAGLALAFWLHSYRSRVYEEVVLTLDTVSWRRILPSGKIESWQAPLPWTKLTTDAPENTRSPLTFTYAGQTLDFGYFLSPEDRGSFQAAFQAAAKRLKA